MQAIRRVCVAVDLERYSSRIAVEQHRAQHELREILDNLSADLGRERWLTQDQGDGELALLPPGINESHFVPTLVRSLGAALHRINRPLADDARLRMRVAIHEGLTLVAGKGFAGSAVVTVCRLRDAPPLRKALDDDPDALLALVVSQRIYEDVIVEHDLYDLPADVFRRVSVEIPQKGFAAEAWITVPCRRERRAGKGTDSPGRRDEPAPAENGSAPKQTEGGVVMHVGGDWHGRDVVGRDAYNLHDPGRWDGGGR
ncbi:hypothetical protein [Streptosporangium carneum]|nr:hypothetical protein [Streptosporangium carneum]